MSWETGDIIQVAGSLEAKIIRACKRHTGTCSLQCKYREVEDLGQIASFDTRIPAQEGSFPNGFPRS